MSKFYDIGVDRQYEAKSPAEATRMKEKSCDLCCTRPGRRCHCSVCPIATAHEIVMDMRWNIQVPKEQG